MKQSARNMLTSVLPALALGAAVGLAPMTATAQDEVKFGFMLGFTGDYAPWSPALDNAAKLAVEEINKAGGILGKKLVMITEDNRSKVESGVSAARKLINVDKVPVIIGPESDIIVALQDMAKDNKVPVITSSAGTEAIDKSGGTGNFIWRVNASDSFLGVAAGKVMSEELGVKEVAILVENLEGTQSAAAAFKRNYERFGGKVTKEITLTPGQSSYLGELRELAGADPKMVFMAAAQVTGATVMKQAFQRGYEWDWWVSQELQQEDFVNAASVEAVEGVQSWTPGQKDDDPGWMSFIDIYEGMWNEKPQAGFYQAETFDAFIVTALAMVAGGETTGAAVDANLAKIAGPPGEVVRTYEEGVKLLGEGKEINYEGVSGSINFNDTGNVGVPAVRIMEVDKDGNWVTIDVIDASDFPAS